MATIRKQSINSSIIIFIGFAVGAINVIFLFKHYFTPEQFGLTRIITDIALILSTICIAGIVPISGRFFPYYDGLLKKEKNDLFGMAILAITLMCTLLYFSMPILEPLIIRKFGFRSPELIKYLYLIYPVTVSIVIFSTLEVFAWNVRINVTSNFLKELAYRLLTTLLILFWAWGLINSFRTWMNLYAALYFVISGVLLFVLIQTKKYSIIFKPSALTKRLTPIMVKIGSAYFMSALLNIIAKTNDTLIIASQSTGGLADAAIFTIATYLATAMEVPQRSMVSAASPQIAIAWREKDIQKLDRLYKKTALNLLIASTFIFGLIIINQPMLKYLMGSNYSILPVLLIILGATKIVDMGTGLNSQILQLSKNWRVDLFTNMFFVFLSILLNYILTRRYGLIGTAFGGLIAMILFNTIRFIFIKLLFNLQPFTWRNLAALIIVLVIIAIDLKIPSTGRLITDAIFKTIFFASSFALLTIRLNISPEVTELYQIVFSKLKKAYKRN